MNIYNERIINKIVLNKIGILENKYNNKLKIQEISFKIKYKKRKKEVWELYELISLIEQLSGEKINLNLSNIIENNRLVKVNESIFEIKLRKKRALAFINFFNYILISERKNFNINEVNNIDLKQKYVEFKYKTFSIFRKYLVSNYANMETKLKLKLKFNESKDCKNILNHYIFYEHVKNLFKIKN